MKFWLSHIHAPTDQLVPLAKHADDLGFEGVMGPDHLVWWGSSITSKYPYNDSGDVWWPEHAHWPDPWVASSAMVAVTTRIRVGHHVFILSLRDPVNVAKQVATVSAIAGGRVVLAFGIGWMREEFELVGQKFERRGRRVDEMLDVLRLLWTGERVSYEGEFYQLHDVSMLPMPAAKVPIIGAGHSEPALRRAGTRCDGWLGAARFTLGELEPLLARMGEHRAEAGRLTEPFEVIVSLRKRDHTPDGIAAAEAVGVSGLMVAPWSIVPTDAPETLAGKLAAMDAFASSIMS